MKKATLFLLLLSTSLIANASKIVAPNMDLGHWITITDTSAMVEQMLANVPESSRAMVKEMMQKQMQKNSTNEQCITKETLENFDEQLKETFAKQQNCDFDIVESTRTKFVGDLNCSGSKMRVVTNVIDSKRNETKITTRVAGTKETTVTSMSKWQSATCPAGI